MDGILPQNKRRVTRGWLNSLWFLRRDSLPSYIPLPPAELWEQGMQSQCPVSASKHQLCLERKNTSPPPHCIVGAQEGLPAAHPLQEFHFL